MTPKQYACMRLNTSLNAIADILQDAGHHVATLEMKTPYGALVKELENLHEAMQDIYIAEERKH